MAASSVAESANGTSTADTYQTDPPSDALLAALRRYARPLCSGTTERARPADAVLMVEALRWLQRRLDCAGVGRLNYTVRTSESTVLPPLPSLDELARRIALWVERNPDRIDVPMEWLVRRLLDDR